MTKKQLRIDRDIMNYILKVKKIIFYILTRTCKYFDCKDLKLTSKLAINFSPKK